MTNTNNDFKVIEFSMMDKRVFFPLSGLGSFTVQTVLYPLVLLRIRLQLQEGARVYSGLAHATASIIREEGFRGLYSGYFVKSAQIISDISHSAAVFYASTYETVRHAASACPTLTPTQRSFLGGAAASLVAQSLVVPIDVISQHLMVLSRSGTSSASYPGPSIVNSSTRLDQVRGLSPIRLTANDLSSSWSRFRAVSYYIAKAHGIRGFYNGYCISLCTFVPSSALWWAFYDKFCNLIASASSELMKRKSTSSSSARTVVRVDKVTDGTQPHVPRLAVQLVSAPLAGMAAATLVNPIDCVRVRMQVGNSPFRDCVRALWVTEGLRWFTKGLSARLLQTGIFSFWLMLIYEPVKMFCLKDEFREQFRSPGTSSF
ncbi:Mitochondrial carrier protein [Paragonimus heterotremus]|uniref:Mitochondrial carrier protein n=1 Tax=Paragonimus heterotremus TaxID=100268 RepID=A0A8J4TNX7_9TREM|nr:Mitochondrial carrier protein [Paragonimus heterotremus]